MVATDIKDKSPKRRLLFICTVNGMRSATAHNIFEADDRFEAVSRN